MHLQMDASAAAGYVSHSQAARRITEQWAKENLFCLGCSSDKLLAQTTNTPVIDFACPGCGQTYQLKSKNGSFGNSTPNSAYEPKMRAISEGRAPNYVFLQYARETWTISNLFIVPGHFMSPNVIQKRNPLGPNARRAGWVGSNILLANLPSEARILVVYEGTEFDPVQVRANWRRFSFIRADKRAKGGWAADVHSCIRKLQQRSGADQFTLQEFYTESRDRLTDLHPENLNIDAKIRQQLQVLRDGGLLRFLGRGRYFIID